jgi:hypothetical protein
MLDAGLDGALHCIVVDKLPTAISGAVSEAGAASAGGAAAAAAAAAAGVGASGSAFTLKAWESSAPVASDGLSRLGTAEKTHNARILQ